MDRFNRAIDRYCYRHPKFGIRNLMKYIVFINIAVYILSLVDTKLVFLRYLFFSPEDILHGQIWRLITFIFIPMDDNIFFFAISQYFYYFIGRNLESAWGAGRFTIYYALSVLFTAVFGVVAYALSGSVYLIMLHAGYINLSLFFAFATMYPEARVLLFFFIPVKMKWLGIAAAVYYLYNMIVNISLFPFNLLPLVSLLTYLLFFGGTLMAQVRRLLGRPQRPRKSGPINFQAARRQQRRAHKVKPPKGASKNAAYTRKCAVCGRTDAEFPDLEFRYCSRCAGYHCFCQDHINNHVHFTE